MLGHGDIPTHSVRDAMQSNDIAVMGIACAIITNHNHRCVPALNPDDCYQFLVRYFLRCVKDNPDPTDTVHSRYDAARHLCRLLELWHRLPHRPADPIDSIVDGVTQLFRAGDAALQTAIETGFLEHVFHTAELVSLFGHWKDEPVFKAAYDNAMQFARTVDTPKSS